MYWFDRLFSTVNWIYYWHRKADIPYIRKYYTHTHTHMNLTAHNLFWRKRRKITTAQTRIQINVLTQICIYEHAYRMRHTYAIHTHLFMFYWWLCYSGLCACCMLPPHGTNNHFLFSYGYYYSPYSLHSVSHLFAVFFGVFLCLFLLPFETRNFKMISQKMIL